MLRWAALFDVLGSMVKAVESDKLMTNLARGQPSRHYEKNEKARRLEDGPSFAGKASQPSRTEGQKRRSSDRKLEKYWGENGGEKTETRANPQSARFNERSKGRRRHTGEDPYHKKKQRFVTRRAAAAGNGGLPKPDTSS